MAKSALVSLLLLGFFASACEMIAGIDDRKVATGGAPGGKGGGGGQAGTSNGGNLGTGGGAGDAAGLGGGPGGGAGGVNPTGGTARTGGVPGSGAVTGSGGASATGGATSPDAATNPDVPVGTGGIGNAGGTSLGGSSGAGGTTTSGGTTGSGGTRPDAAVERPPTSSDAVPDLAGCPAVGATGTGSGLEGDYFPNKTLTNSVFTRLDPSVNFDWQYGAPEATLPTDGFSIRWTGQVQPRFSGVYTFITDTDDGVRLWVNGTQLVDDWNDWAVRENTGTITLVAGQKYDIRMEYYESGGLATAQLSWSSNCQPREVIPPSQLYAPAVTCADTGAGTGTGLVGNYYDNPDLTGLQMIRVDQTVSFVWPDGSSPDPSIAPLNYTVRWTGQVESRYGGWTTFYVTSDDGARLFVDDKLVIDDWTSHAATEDMGSANTIAGQKYNLRLEYFQTTGVGQVQLRWCGFCQPKEIVPQAQLFTTYAATVCPDPGVGTGTGLRGDYYDNMDFTNLVATHMGENINFDWGTGAPDPKVGADTFSIRWTGKLLARYTGSTTFHTWSDDGVRLWIDGQPIIDDWTDHQVAEDVGTANLVAGQLHTIRLDFHENLENAVIKLAWTSACQPLEMVPASQLFPPSYGAPDAAIDTAEPVDTGAAIDGGVDGP